MDWILGLLSLCTTRDKTPVDLDDDTRPMPRSSVAASSRVPFGKTGSPYSAEQASINTTATKTASTTPSTSKRSELSRTVTSPPSTIPSVSHESSREAARIRRDRRAKVKIDDQESARDDTKGSARDQTTSKPQTSAQDASKSVTGSAGRTEVVAPPLQKPKARSMSSSNPKCEVCGKTAYMNESELDAKNNAYHKTCFKCAVCKKSLSGTAFVKHTDGRLYCNDVSGAGRGCLQRMQLRTTADSMDIVKGTDVKAEQDRSLPDGAARVSEVMDVIGAQLEKSVGSMVPRCSVCGSTFSATDEMIQFGAVRTHRGCLGKERNTSKVNLNVREAAGLVEKTLAVRLHWCGRPKTFLLVTDVSRPVELTNDRAVFEYAPDLSARADSSRLYDASQSDGTAQVEGLGDWKAFQAVTPNAEVDEDALTITHTLAAIKSGVLFSVCVRFTIDPTRAIVNSNKAHLTLTKHTSVDQIAPTPTSHARARPSRKNAPTRTGGKRELSSDEEA